MRDPSETLSQGFAALNDQFSDFRSEYRADVAARVDWSRGVKWFRLPLMQGNVAASAISIGEQNGVMVGPLEGYFWAIRRILVQGLATGATPDVVNLYRSSSLQEGGLLWQFNGNNFGYTFGKTELTLMSGDRLQLVNVGTITAAAGTLITVSGEYNQVPAEMMSKLIL